ncbi:MAG: DUF2550 domain-containing protein [Nocardioides sp.]|nr:DUF2550 domain-containing protein [Nocardioides sp.]
MPLWQWLLDIVGVLLLLVVLYGVTLVVRRRLLSRHGGTFELSVRVRTTTAGRGWVLGLGRYYDDTLQWFRIFSVSPRPRAVYVRTEIDYVGRRTPEGAETYSLYADHVVVECETPSGLLELAMSREALTGFQAWTEAAPPGQARRP